ncbi:hypothetical protein TrVE_jg3595 [Triparma verrucosa]|uniref:Intimal thickness related receptor IRP domain-containing protein n=1 Tax=Triparma verrucosa TaxID=1606542 RepID=A0A9W7F738_9STRA|nr:hypothetical protein TrVE_jg3595 [Triparma verrucosa]
MSSSKRLTGRVFSAQSWLYTDRFCFYPAPVVSEGLETGSNGDADDDYGKILLKTTFPKNHNLKILFYWGSFSDWKTIYEAKHSELSCGEREELANFKVRLDQNSTTNPLLVPDDPSLQDTHHMAVTEHQFHAITPYYFFIALSNCDTYNDMYPDSNDYMYSQGHIDATVDFLLTNGNTLDSKHFGADEMGIFGMTIGFFLTQIFVLIGFSLVRIALINRRKFHFTVKIFGWALVLQFMSLLMVLCYYSNYSTQGMADENLNIAAGIFSALAETVMVLLLISLAKGWTVVRRKISIAGRIKMALFATLYLMASLTVVVWRHMTKDSALQLYYFDSSAGWVYIGSRVTAFVWFLRCCRTTRKQFRKKLGFYTKFMFFFGTWFLLNPFIIVFCNYIGDWLRFKIVYCFMLITMMSGQIAMLLMYNPTHQYNKSFPFHAMTSAMMMNKGGQPRGISGGARGENVGPSSMGSDTLRRSSGEPRSGEGGKIVVSNPFERQHVAELRDLDRFIGDTLEALRHQQNDLRRILISLDDGTGGRSVQNYGGPPRQNTAPLNSQSRFTSSNLRSNQGYQQISQAEQLERERERERLQRQSDVLKGPPSAQSNRHNFDEWWDEMAKKKEPQNAVRRPTHAAAAILPPDFGDRLGDAPAPSPDPYRDGAVEMSDFKDLKSPTSESGVKANDFIESEFKKPKVANSVPLRKPSVMTVSVARATRSTPSTPPPVVPSLENSNPLPPLTGDNQALAKKEKKEKKKKKKKNKDKSKSKLPPGMASPTGSLPPGFGAEEKEGDDRVESKEESKFESKHTSNQEENDFLTSEIRSSPPPMLAAPTNPESASFLTSDTRSSPPTLRASPPSPSTPGVTSSFLTSEIRSSPPTLMTATTSPAQNSINEFLTSPIGSSPPTTPRTLYPESKDDLDDDGYDDDFGVNSSRGRHSERRPDYDGRGAFLGE